MDPTRAQYERFPYPPVPAFATPRSDQGDSLKYETGAKLGAEIRSHRGIRILVAGAGTLEALVVALAHPRAREVIAVDVSEASLSRLKLRTRIARVTRIFRGFAPIKTVRADLREWEPGGFEPSEGFDYILASNVLHHVEDPAALLKRLSGWLKPSGLMRVVTYPKASRIWMRETGRWFRLSGIHPESPNLKKQARAAIQPLPPAHPIRSCYESQPETSKAAGFVDAFLHACETPLSPLQWREACDSAQLELLGEMQTESSRSGFLGEIEPATANLDPWEKLQILDDLLELCANPVLWLRRSPLQLSIRATPLPQKEPPRSTRASQDPDTQAPFSMPSRVRFEMADGLRRVEKLLLPSGVTLETLLQAFREKVGPRVTAPQRGIAEQVLPGLSITDYEASKILNLPQCWNRARWDLLEKQIGPGWHLETPDHTHVCGDSLADQAEWLQLKYGAMMDWLPTCLKRS